MSLPATPGTTQGLGPTPAYGAASNAGSGSAQPDFAGPVSDRLLQSPHSADGLPGAGSDAASVSDNMTDIPVLTEVLKHQPPPVESLAPLPGRPLLSMEEEDASEPSLDDSFADLAQAGQPTASSQAMQALNDKLVSTAAISASDQVIASLPDQPRSICGPGARTIWPKGIPNPPLPVPIVASAPAQSQATPITAPVAAPIAALAPTIVRPSDDDLLQLEGRVWQRLERRLGQRIDVQLQFSLARLVDKAMEDTLAELKLGLRESLRMMLAESVRDEIRRDPAVTGAQPAVVPPAAQPVASQATRPA